MGETLDELSAAAQRIRDLRAELERALLHRDELALAAREQGEPWSTIQAKGEISPSVLAKAIKKAQPPA